VPVVQERRDPPRRRCPRNRLPATTTQNLPVPLLRSPLEYLPRVTGEPRSRYTWTAKTHARVFPQPGKPVPAGCQYWEAHGGFAAWSDFSESVWSEEHHRRATAEEVLFRTPNPEN
jgi:hypothetical protein